MADPKTEIPSWLEKVIEKGGDVNVCLSYLKEKAEKEESLRLKEIEREDKLKTDEAERAERAAVRAEKAALRDAEEKEKDRQLRILQLETDKEIKLKELEIKALEIDKKPAASEIKPKVALPKYDQHQDIEVFLTSFERLAELHKWPKEDWPIRLVPQLSGKALEAYSRMSVPDSKSYEKIKRAIFERFGLNPMEYRDKFRNAKQLGDETFKEYAIRVSRYFEHWKDSEEVENDYFKLTDLIIRDQLLYNCSSELQTYLQEKEPKSLSDLVALANAYQLAHKNKETKKFYRPPHLRYQNREYEGNDNSSSGAVGGSVQFSKPWEKRKFFHCQSEDHLIAKCPFKLNLNEKNDPSRRKDKENQANGLIHSPTKCEHRYREIEIPVENSMNENTGNKTLILTNGLIISDGKVDGKDVKVLRDTGCTTIFISEYVSKKGQKTGTCQNVTLADGSNLKCPEVLVQIETAYISGKVKALIMNNPFADLVIGNVGHIQNENNKDSFQAVETRALKQKREKEEIVQRLTEEKIQSERLHHKELSSIIENSDKNESSDLGQMNTDVDIDLSISKDQLLIEQEKDVTLINVKKYVVCQSDIESTCCEKKKRSYFIYENEILYRVFISKFGDRLKQIVVPLKFRDKLLQIAHDVPLGGHLGNRKTRQRILQSFFWPGIFIDVAHYCRTCAVCQKTVKKGKVFKAPLISIPPVDEPFARIAMDIVGPLVRSEKGNRFILVVCDYGTKYPEAIPLKTIDAETVANALIDIFSRTGIPREILSDQGSNFMSATIKHLCSLLHIKKLKTSPYHPQANGLVENFNGTLKKMLKCYSDETAKDWDKNIPYVLFAYREAKHETTGFSPFEMLYGRHVRGPLSIVKEEWEDLKPEDVKQSAISYILDARERLKKMTALANSREISQKEKQKKYFDKKTKDRQLKVHDKVLLLLPTSTNNLLAEWRGPYEIIDQVSPVDYTVKMKKKTKTFHINMIKKWYDRHEDENLEVDNQDEIIDEADDRHFHSICIIYGKEGDFAYEDIENPLLVPHESVNDIRMDSLLTEEQKQQLNDLCKEFDDVLTDVPGRTSVIEHKVVLNSETPVYKRPYTMPYAVREKVEQEVKNMLNAGIVEKSKSAYGAPIVVVQKKDASMRLCIDYRGLNEITVFDPQPMPKLDDIFNKLGKAKFISKIDCTKGFWQIPLEESAKEKSGFVTPFGHFQFNVMPFGMVNSGATFVRLMKIILEGLEDFSDAFIDDVIIFSDSFHEHLDHLKQVLLSFRKANVTAKPSKTLLGFRELEFLAHKVGNGAVHPTEEKIDAINRIVPPTTKKQVRSFIGTMNFYRRFIPHFSEIALPLTDLTTKDKSNKVKWLQDHQIAFDKLKQCITQYPVLRSPNFDKVFYLQTDASDRGIGAVLLQEDCGIRHPVMYISKKLNSAEEAYSTIEKECLAIVKSVQKLREYLLGTEFVIECDHFPLQWLNKAKDNNMRLLRWSLLLQEYRFRIHHIPGVKNAVADLLSRFHN